MIQVVTHNGLSPSQGGKRLGYLFSCLDGSTRVVPVALAPMIAPPPALPKPEVEQKAGLAMAAAASFGASVRTSLAGSRPNRSVIRVRDSTWGDVPCPCGCYIEVAESQEQVACAYCGQVIDILH